MTIQLSTLLYAVAALSSILGVGLLSGLGWLILTALETGKQVQSIHDELAHLRQHLGLEPLEGS